MDDYSVLVLLGRAFLQRRQLLPDGRAHIDLWIGVIQVLGSFTVLDEVGRLFERLLERGCRGDRVFQERLAEVGEVAVIGAAGPLVPSSGFSTLLNAARRVLDAGIDAEFVLVP